MGKNTINCSEQFLEKRSIIFAKSRKGKCAVNFGIVQFDIEGYSGFSPFFFLIIADVFAQYYFLHLQEIATFSRVRKFIGIAHYQNVDGEV